MKLPAILNHLSLVLHGYDKRHHRNALWDSVCVTVSIFFTSIAWGLLTYFNHEVPPSYYLVASGIMRGAQLYFGIVLITSLLGFFFDTFSPYRHILASVCGVIALGVCLVTSLNHTLPPPEFFGMAITLMFACYSSVTTLIRLLVSESSFAQKWRELSSNK